MTSYGGGGGGGAATVAMIAYDDVGDDRGSAAAVTAAAGGRSRSPEPSRNRRCTVRRGAPVPPGSPCRRLLSDPRAGHPERFRTARPVVDPRRRAPAGRRVGT